MPKIEFDWFGVALAALLFLWTGKELNLLPFIYGSAPCTPPARETK